MKILSLLFNTRLTITFGSKRLNLLLGELELNFWNSHPSYRSGTHGLKPLGSDQRSVQDKIFSKDFPVSNRAKNEILWPGLFGPASFSLKDLFWRLDSRYQGLELFLKMEIWPFSVFISDVIVFRFNWRLFVQILKVEWISSFTFNFF